MGAVKTLDQFVARLAENVYHRYMGGSMNPWSDAHLEMQAASFIYGTGSASIMRAVRARIKSKYNRTV